MYDDYVECRFVTADFIRSTPIFMEIEEKLLFNILRGHLSQQLRGHFRNIIA